VSLFPGGGRITLVDVEIIRREGRTFFPSPGRRTCQDAWPPAEPLEILALDGINIAQEGRRLRFVLLPPPNGAEIAQVAVRIARRIVTFDFSDKHRVPGS